MYIEIGFTLLFFKEFDEGLIVSASISMTLFLFKDKSSKIYILYFYRWASFYICYSLSLILFY